MAAEQKHSTASLLHLVGFHVGGEYFGVPIEHVQEILRVPEITPVPESAWCVEGVINLRGRIIPVVDLRKRLQLGAPTASRHSRILIVEGDSTQIGLLVDTASEVLRLSPEAVEPPPPMLTAIGGEYITGVAKLPDRLLLLLDLGRILNPAEIRKIEQASRQASERVALGDPSRTTET